MFCQSKNNIHLCSDLHIEQADSSADITVGIFCVHGLSYSSVPCGALMRPLPVQGGDQRGAELFIFSPYIKFCFILNDLQKNENDCIY